MIRMEIALILVLAFIAYIYFGAERKHTLLHRTFSVLLVALIVNLIFDAATVYTVNHLDTVPALLNAILHRLFIGSMVFVVYLFYQYIAILVEEETGKARSLDLAARVFLVVAEIGVFVLGIEYIQTPNGNYSAENYCVVSYASVVFYLLLCAGLLLSNWKQIHPQKRFAIGIAMAIEFIVCVLQGFNPTWLISGMGMTLMTLEEEMDMIMAYLERICYRYPKLEVTYDVGDELLEYPVPNFILQPIVENSLLYGLKNRGYEGNIHISAHRTDQGMEICVKDNGTGFADGKKEQMEEMLLHYDRVTKLEGNSIGVINVQKRIKLLCGKKYGLWYTENAEGGLTAHLLLGDCS